MVLRQIELSQIKDEDILCYRKVLHAPSQCNRGQPELIIWVDQELMEGTLSTFPFLSLSFYICKTKEQLPRVVGVK